MTKENQKPFSCKYYAHMKGVTFCLLDPDTLHVFTNEELREHIRCKFCKNYVNFADKWR